MRNSLSHLEFQHLLGLELVLPNSLSQRFLNSYPVIH